ncbi:MAG: aldehyde dehydrogenase family protein [Bacteroidales bacterium]
MEHYDIYCGGDFITTSKTIRIRNPYDGEVFASSSYGENDELQLCIERAQGVEQEMADMPGWKRSEILNEIADKLEGNIDYHVRLLAQEAGKPLKYASGEVKRAIQTFRIAAEEARRLPGEHISLDWTPAGEGKEGWVKYFPAGLVAAIAPFNFPLNLAVHKIAPALAAGCPVILKPATSTPLSTLALAKLIDDTDLPKGAFSVLPMARETGNQLVTDDRFKLLSFTGSPEIGWEMKKNAGKKKIVLELGGNAGVIVTRDVDMDNCIKKCLTGAFAYSGQVCIHAQRIFVEAEIFDEFIERFTAEAKKLKVGSPLEESTDISAMIDENNAQRVQEWVKEAEEQGAKVLTGGRRENAVVHPVVLTNTNNEMKVCGLEVFGPVVAVEPFNDFSKALKMVNDSRYGLQAGVFTDSVKRMNLAFRNLEVGGVIINDVPTFRVDHMPYGGVKDSGIGREGVRYAMMDMLEPKIMVKDL